MLLDDFLPRYEVRERHRILVHASLARTYAAVRRFDVRRARWSTLLFRLRRLPTRKSAAPLPADLDGLLQMGFILLGERPPEELLLGAIGRFWAPVGELRRLDPEGYRNFHDPGYAKAAWNFSLTEQSAGTVLLETETRVAALDDASRRRLRCYWRLIAPFSGFIRRELLRVLKQNAEA
ncbi:MAG: hypothetical protein JO022_06155 [Acidobacteriaceae bacterium]|nr:hypothetical protein [Acidobacteriaceae bacterium]